MDRPTKVAVGVLVLLAALALWGGISGGGGGNRALPDVAAIRESVLQRLAPPALELRELRADRESCLREPDQIIVPVGQKCALCVRRSSERMRKGTFVLAGPATFQVDFSDEPKTGPDVPCPGEAGLKLTPSCLGAQKKCDRGKGAQVMAPSEGGRFVISCRRLDGRSGGACTVKLRADE